MVAGVERRAGIDDKVSTMEEKEDGRENTSEFWHKRQLSETNNELPCRQIDRESLIEAELLLATREYCCLSYKSYKLATRACRYAVNEIFSLSTATIVLQQ